MEKQYDIIIIGSGVGGGTVADIFRKYTKKGLKVLIIEGGAYRKKEFFNQKEADMSSIYFNKGAFLSDNLHISLAAGKTVGGSSAVYTGVSFRPPKSVIENWKSSFGLSFLTDDYVEQTLLEHENKLNIKELPESYDNDNNRLFKEGANNLNIELKRLRINVRGCEQQGFCNLGCTVGAKQGTLELQIPDSVADGIELIYNAWVYEITNNSVKFSISKAVAGTEPNIWKEGAYELKAKVIVLAGGVLQTPALVLRSLKKLKIKNKLIGRYLSLHPVFNLNAVYKEKIKNYNGFPKTFYIDQFSDSEGYYLETSFYYPGITAKNIPGYGKTHQDFMHKYEQMMSILILSHDPSEYHNRISIDKNGKPILNYRVNKDVKESLIKAIRKAAAIFFAAGCTEMIIPGTSKYLLNTQDIESLTSLIQSKNLKFERTPLSSAHPQGGMRMSNDKTTGVVNTDGLLNGTNCIYVADASLFPTSVKVNPYQTIMLLTNHVANRIIHKHFPKLLNEKS